MMRMMRESCAPLLLCRQCLRSGIPCIKFQKDPSGATFCCVPMSRPSCSSPRACTSKLSPPPPAESTCVQQCREAGHQASQLSWHVGWPKYTPRDVRCSQAAGSAVVLAEACGFAENHVIHTRSETLVAASALSRSPILLPVRWLPSRPARGELFGENTMLQGAPHHAHR